jgi:hypothetical protein
MAVETVADPQDLNVSYPEATDDISAGDDHLRNIKVALKKCCWEEVGTYAASGASSVNTYTQFGAFVAGYDYLLVLDEAYLSGTGVTLNLRVTTGGGTPHSGSDYAYTYLLLQATETNTSGSGVATIPMAANFSDLSTQRGVVEVFIFNPGGTSNPRNIDFDVVMLNSAGTATYISGTGAYQAATAADGVAVYPASGTMTGTAKLYRRFRP